ncbi:hypothetical protein DUNSADRAFT_2971 [Dunaliella salina]|uniref:EF-hand domain-containing protein n=1 Tax=Dunaliella salina TaxID=3046 RepID=A0ABQ7GUR9_DUNSA|nr:hypothetical protein DUNSADRAFT_2971 [Dunaliella salina]|eukprot:KAF5838361.1 hypothetical protein DUNSADRAFT_2971 [Dunaliella salina]
MTNEALFAPREWGTLPNITHHDPLSVQVPPRRASSAGEVPAVFQALDANRRNVLDFRAAFAGLGQLGVANGQDTIKTVSGLLGMSSPSHVKTHQFTLPEFVACYEMLSRAHYKPSRLDQAVLYSRASEILEGADNELILKLVYTNYCRYTVGQGKLIFDEADPKMSSTQFVKLACDLGVLQPTGPLNVVVIDLIFHKCKQHGKNRFQFPDFLKVRRVRSHS